MSRHHTVRPGLASIEAVVASALVAVLAVGVAQVLSAQSARATASADRSAALTIARSETERLAAAGPLSLSRPVISWSVRADGVADTAGAFRVVVSRRVRCVGGQATDETPAALLALGCGERLPVISYAVGVAPPGQEPVVLTTTWSSEQLGAPLAPAEPPVTTPSPVPPPPGIAPEPVPPTPPLVPTLPVPPVPPLVPPPRPEPPAPPTPPAPRCEVVETERRQACAPGSRGGVCQMWGSCPARPEALGVRAYSVRYEEVCTGPGGRVVTDLGWQEEVDYSRCPAR